MSLATIEIQNIDVGQRLRSTSEAQVEALIASIGDVGLLNPITVYPCKVFRSGSYVEGFGVVAGAHRLEACKRLGLAEIEANVVSLSDLERQIAECDENLCATTLSKSERALFTKRRKDAYEALHPETKNGGDRRGPDRQVGELKEADRFTADTATKTGQSERAVQRDAERGTRISADVLNMVKNTKLDTGSYLDRIKHLSPNEQVTAAKRDLEVARQQNGIQRRIVSKAPISDEEAREKQVAALMTAWNNASAEARSEFMARIDTPVFDRSAA